MRTAGRFASICLLAVFITLNCCSIGVCDSPYPGCKDFAKLQISIKDSRNSAAIQGAQVSVGRTYSKNIDERTGTVVSCSTSGDVGTESTNGRGVALFNRLISLYQGNLLNVCVSISGYTPKLVTDVVIPSGCGNTGYAVVFMDRVQSPENKTHSRNLNSQNQQITNNYSQNTGINVDSDNHFIVNNNGTVLDTRTNLIWAERDNGENISWANAKSYCENYRGGGYSDWRLPTLDELASLYDESKSRKYNAYDLPIHLTDLISFSFCYAWASGRCGELAEYFDFRNGRRACDSQYLGGTRALPVRLDKTRDIKSRHKKSN